MMWFLLEVSSSSSWCFGQVLFVCFFVFFFVFFLFFFCFFFGGGVVVVVCCCCFFAFVTRTKLSTD